MDWQRIDDALVSCAGLLRTLCKDEIGDTAAAELEYVRSAIAHPVQPGWRPTHRHVKRGGEYMLLGIGKVQCDWWQITSAGNRYPVDMHEVVIYRGEDGKLWVRPREEFEDGRFEALPAAPQPKG